jgi:aspartate 1-decarboxylase
LLGAKAHGLVAAGKDLRYDVSPTLERDVMEVSEFYSLEHVEAHNVSDGARFTTYVIPRRDGEVVLNGAVARLGEVGDVIIVAAYDCVADPRAVFQNNKVREVKLL